MLHILNGDGTANVFKQAGIPGEDIIIWREILSEGPIIDHHSAVDFWQARQHYIADMYNENALTYIDKVTAEVKRLETFLQHEEVVLWFEHDLLCQVNLLYLLHWFAQHQTGSTAISLVCIATHPEKPNFRGLGELSPAQLAALYPQRQWLTPADLSLGDQGWQAYAAPTPEPLLTYLQEDFTHLPLLLPALQAHLTRFPSVQNGLNAIEQILLEIISESNPSPLELFQKFWQRTTLFGIGDSQIVNYLKDLEQVGLIKVGDNTQITPLGMKVQQGAADYVQLKPLNRWLGGVHLQPGQPYWRWDVLKEEIILL